MGLKDKVPASAIPSPSSREPLWKGPEVDGISFSLLSHYLVDLERSRVQMIEGLAPFPSFNHRIEFGTMWHAAEEGLAGQVLKSAAHRLKPWAYKLKERFVKLCNDYPTQGADIAHWYKIADALFPVYVKYWERHPDMVERTPLLTEEVFNVCYKLPSGRVVRLRGKRDGVDYVRASDAQGVWVQENKTKTGINISKMTRFLTFDLQTMIYFVALAFDDETLDRISHMLKTDDYPIKGVRYNVVRRPAHKSTESMLKKVEEDMADGRAQEWFARWNTVISQRDMTRFRTECLDPVLENLWDDWEWWYYCKVHGDTPTAKALYGKKIDAFNSYHRNVVFPKHQRRHFRMPYGIYNPLMEGGETDVDNFINTGSTVGLVRLDTLFPELEEADASG